MKMEVEKKYIENQEDEKIAAVIHKPNQEQKGVLLLQHGLFSDKEGSWERRAKFFAEKGFKAIRFDRRGYGESDREFQDFNLATGIKDTITVLDHQEENGEENFAIYGSSFGGLIGIHAAAQDSRISSLGLRAPATFTSDIFSEIEKTVLKEGKISLEDEMEGAFMDKSFFEALEKYDAIEAAEEIDVPIIIFHGTEDDVVPIEDSRKFYQLLETRKEIHEISGEGHVFSTEKDNEVLKKASDWFAETIS